MTNKKQRAENISNILDQLKIHQSAELESETLEFKAYKNEDAIHNSKDLAQEISALANSLGGTIIIGVIDDENCKGADQLRGIEKVDSLLLRERLSGKLKPKKEIEIGNFNFEGKNYIFIEVPRSHETLVSTSGGKVYTREGRSSRPMEPEEIEKAVKSLAKYDWSADIMDLDVTTSLDPKAVKEAKKDFIQRRGLQSDMDTDHFLEAIDATRNGSLTKTGLLFLGKKEVIRDHLGLYECRFSWKTKNGRLKIHDIWDGCLWFAISNAKKYFSECNRRKTFKYKEDRFSVPLLDPQAFHEAYLNALVHRDYSSDGMVSVTYTGKKLVVTSPGGFYGGITSDNIALHEPRHRNKALARTLMEFHLVDRAGMGVMRMSLGSLRYGRSFPVFKETDTGSIEVSMEAEFLKSPIAALSLVKEEEYGIPELLILNHVHEKGVVPVAKLENELKRHSDSPWEEILDAVAKMPLVELCGDTRGIYVRVLPKWKEYMEVGPQFKPSSNSRKHVALYSYLKKHGEASNADLKPVLGYGHSSQVSDLLRIAKYTKRKGSGKTARWFLVPPEQ